MNEIKSSNIIYNSAVFASWANQPETNPAYISALFLPGEAPSEWIVDIYYHDVKQEEEFCGTGEKCEKIKGKIEFINPNDPNDRIGFDFCKDSKITHKGSFDEITLDPTAHNPNIERINIEVAHEGENTIVQGLFIQTHQSEKVNEHLVNYEHLQFTPSIMIPALTSTNIEMMVENAANLDTIAIFATNYYSDSYANFNPLHG